MWSIIDQCVLCRAPADATIGLCRACHTALPRNLAACRVCALPLPAPGMLCSECQHDPPPFHRVHAPLLYSWPVSELLNDFKHRGRLDTGRVLADLMIAVLQDSPRETTLVPVPLNRARLAERGFNQVNELVGYLGRRLGYPVERRLLRRTDNHAHQQGSGRRDRRANVKSVFRTACATPPAHVMLVDDVVTTGSTAREAAWSLRQAGVTIVEVLAIARTPRRSSR